MSWGSQVGCVLTITIRTHWLSGLGASQMQFITHILLQADLPTVNLLDAQDVQKELVLVWMCASRLYVSVRLRLYFLLSSVDVCRAIRFSLSMMRVKLTRPT